MPTAPANDIEICYETVGDAADPTLLLINGLSSQLINYEEDLCRQLAERGHHVVRFDNRDVGLTTWFDDAPTNFGAGFKAYRAKEPVPAPYTLSDMAADAVGLLDHLGIDQAHVVGMSMGGMIAQTVAIEHPSRVASLCSIMSTTGDRDVGKPTPEANEVLLASPPTNREEAIGSAIAFARVIGSPAWFDADRLAERAGAAYDRAFHPEGTARQLLAVWASGSRTEALASVRCPALVIHGEVDPLIPLDGGRRTAESLPDADFFVVPGMGHDLPPQVWPMLTEALSCLVARSARRGAAVS